MRRLCSLLGMPQNRFASIHVVGTNGKTSVALMTMELLEARDVSSGAYVSPHIASWRERIRIRGKPISEEALTRALERAEQAARVADRSAGDEGPVTQFELLTAAAFVAFADARITIAVIEAGLGGRLDATNVIPSKVTVLTSVGLDHTEWLGETLPEIAAEKLAVLRDHSTLITGPLPDEVLPVVEREVERRHARRPSTSRVDWWGPGPGNGPPGYQRGNAEIAWSAVKAMLELPDDDVIPERLEHALASFSIPGRAQLIPGDPPLIVDAAHNADGARALAETLPVLSGGKKVVCCIAVLEGKDAGAIVAALAPQCAVAVCTMVPEATIAAGGRPGGRAIDEARLVSLFEAEGVEAAAVPEPTRALERASALARERSLPVLVTGSHFLLGPALAAAGA